MALADIIARIKLEAKDESSRIVGDGTKQNESIIDDAHVEAKRIVDSAVEVARSEAQRDSNTTLVAARMTARDVTLNAKRVLLDRAKTGIVDRIGTLDDMAWVELYAPRIIEARRGGESIRFGSLDTRRAGALRLALQQDGCDFTFDETPAQFERGVMLVGNRTSVDLSVSSLVANDWRKLEPIVTDALFAADSNAEFNTKSPSGEGS